MCHRQVDPRFLDACHRAQDYTNKMGQLAYVVYSKSAQRYEALTSLTLPTDRLVRGDLRLAATTEL